jgi:hypothetical protein
MLHTITATLAKVRFLIHFDQTQASKVQGKKQNKKKNQNKNPKLANHLQYTRLTIDLYICIYQIPHINDLKFIV